MERKKIEAVIFDLDGTVLENEDEWEKAVVTVGRNNELTMTDPALLLEGSWVHEPGIGLFSNWRRILEIAGKFENDRARQLVSQTVIEYERLNPDPKIREGMEDVVAAVKERGWLTALCTGSSWHVAEKALGKLGMTLAFDVTTTGEEVYMSKPDPEIYLLTSQKLEIDPRNCLVIEDAVAGVRAAKEVEMKVIGLVSEYASSQLLKAAGADFVAEDISELKEILVQMANEPGGEEVV